MSDQVRQHVGRGGERERERRDSNTKLSLGSNFWESLQWRSGNAKVV